MQTYEITLEHQKSKLRQADTYRLSQMIEDHNKHKFNWRDSLKPFNHMIAWVGKVMVTVGQSLQEANQPPYPQTMTHSNL